MYNNFRIATILFLILCSPAVFSAGHFIGQHIFYLSSYKFIQSEQFDGIRIWNVGTKESSTWRDIHLDFDSYNFELLDLQVDNAISRKMDVMYTLGQTPIWASSRPTEKGEGGFGSAAEPIDFKNWYNYVYKVADRYKGRISTYEAMNEPRTPEVFKPWSPGFFNGSTAILVNMTQQAKDAISSADPAAKLVCPAMTGGVNGIKQLDFFFQNGGGKYCDIIGFHFYLNTGTLDEFIGLLNDIKYLRIKYNLTNMPIWNTEIGLLVKQSGTNVQPKQPTGTFSRVWQDNEAAKLMLKVVLASAVGGVERTYWFAHDATGMGSTLPNKTVGALNALGVAIQEVRAWLKDNEINTCDIKDLASNCVLTKKSNVPVGRITWGNRLRLDDLVKEGVKVISFLNGQKYSIIDLRDSQLSVLTNDFIEPIFIQY